MKSRLDIILHEPFDPQHHADRTQGNFAVIELKPNAKPAKAKGDFDSLREILDALAYPLGTFVSITSTATHADFVEPRLRGRLVCFAVSLANGIVRIVEDAT